MEILFLPGFSVKNRDEMAHISDKLTLIGHQVIQHSWPHWEDESIQWDAYAEVEKVLGEAAQFTSPFIVIGKSIGTHVSALLAGRVDPQLIRSFVLMGVPVLDLNEQELNDYRNFAMFDGKITLLHNEFDKRGRWTDVQRLFTDINYSPILKPGNDSHSYDYPDDILKLISTF